MSSFLTSLFSLFRGGNIADQLTPLGIHTSPDAATLRLQNRAGQQITLNENTIVIQDTNGNVITLDTSGVHIQAATNINLNASKLVINSSDVAINSGMVKVSGVVQCDTIIATNVVGTNYTPGAGNIW